MVAVELVSAQVASLVPLPASTVTTAGPASGLAPPSACCPASGTSTAPTPASSGPPPPGLGPPCGTPPLAWGSDAQPISANAAPNNTSLEPHPTEFMPCSPADGLRSTRRRGVVARALGRNPVVLGQGCED